MWRSLLVLALLVGFTSLMQASPAEAQSTAPTMPSSSGATSFAPTTGLAPGTVGAWPALSFAGAAFGSSPCSFPGFYQLASIPGSLSGPPFVRYATYSDGWLVAPPSTGPNPQILIADAIVPYNMCAGTLQPIVGSTPGSFGYNVGPRRGFNPYATTDSYLQTLNAVVAPDGMGYILTWTSGTSFSGTSHEVFQCPEADTPLMACRSAGVVNAEVRTLGPVPGGFTYVIRSQGYGGLTGTVGWGGGLEAGSNRLPLPLVPPPTAGGSGQ
jgi:hypothetical protein